MPITLKPHLPPIPGPKAATIQVEVRKARAFVIPAVLPTAPASLLPQHQDVAPTVPVQVSQVVPQSPPPDTGEVLITRSITFRNSTFGAVKTFQRQHEARTGVRLTNAAIVDALLRERLAYHLTPRAATEMFRLSRPGAAEALRSVADKGEA